LDTAIESNRREMERAQRTLDSFDQAQGRYTSLGYVTRGLAAREEQKEEREAMRNIIAEAEAENDKLYDQRSELASEVRAFEVEVGPIKYIAELIYGESGGNLEQAVRAVILLLIFVFDPLAVLLLIAANQSLVREQRGSRVRKEVWDAYQKIAEEDKEILEALDDGDTYQSAAVKASRPTEWLTKGKLVVDKDNISKL